MLENQQSNRNDNTKINRKKDILNPINFELIIERKTKPILTALSNIWSWEQWTCLKHSHNQFPLYYAFSSENVPYTKFVIYVRTK